MSDSDNRRMVISDITSKNIFNQEKPTSTIRQPITFPFILPNPELTVKFLHNLNAYSDISTMSRTKGLDDISVSRSAPMDWKDLPQKTILSTEVVDPDGDQFSRSKNLSGGSDVSNYPKVGDDALTRSKEVHADPPISEKPPFLKSNSGTWSLLSLFRWKKNPERSYNLKLGEDEECLLSDCIEELDQTNEGKSASNVTVKFDPSNTDGNCATLHLGLKTQPVRGSRFLSATINVEICKPEGGNVKIKRIEPEGHKIPSTAHISQKEKYDFSAGVKLQGFIHPVPGVKGGKNKETNVSYDDYTISVNGIRLSRYKARWIVAENPRVKRGIINQLFQLETVDPSHWTLPTGAKISLSWEEKKPYFAKKTHRIPPEKDSIITVDFSPRGSNRTL